MRETDVAAMGILDAGMVTGVGFDAASSCAAIRCGITGFREIRFMFGGEWMLGCEVPFEESYRGREKLLQMVVPSIRECTRDPRGATSKPPLHYDTGQIHGIRTSIRVNRPD